MNTITAFSKAKNMVKINNGIGDTWYWLTPNVQKFISNFSVGQEVEITIEEKNGKNLVSFLKVTGEAPKKEVKEVSGFKCEDCGSTLKDNKYPTCYNCSMKRREKTDSHFKPEVLKEEKTVSFRAVSGSKQNFEFQCSECGTELKDSTYPTCYTCSMKLKAATNKSPEIQDSIKRQAIAHAVSRSLISLQGHLDLTNIYEVSEKLYHHYQKLVG